MNLKKMVTETVNLTVNESKNYNSVESLIENKDIGLIVFNTTIVLINIRNGSGIGYIQLGDDKSVINVKSLKGYGQSLYIMAMILFKGVKLNEQGRTSKEAELVWKRLMGRKDVDINKNDSQNIRDWLFTYNGNVNLKNLIQKGNAYSEENFVSIIELIDDIDRY